MYIEYLPCSNYWVSRWNRIRQPEGIFKMIFSYKAMIKNKTNSLLWSYIRFDLKYAVLR